MPPGRRPEAVNPNAVKSVRAGPERLPGPSTGRRIFVLMTAFTAFWSALAALWWIDTAARLADLNLLGRQELEERIRRILELEERDLLAQAASFARESARLFPAASDEGPGSPARRDQREPLSPRAAATAAAVFDSHGHVLAVRGDPGILPLPEQLPQAGSGPERTAFFIPKGGFLTHVAVLRVSGRGGWAVAARRWDRAELDRLRTLAGGTVRVEEPGAPRPRVREGVDRTEIPGVLRGPDGKLPGTLAVEVARPRLEAHRRQALRYALLFGLSSIGGIVLLGFLLSKLVCQPVGLILRAIRERDPATLDRLAAHRTDMGELARLVQDFFRKEKALADETLRARQFHGELKRLYAAIEHSPDTIVITDLCGTILYANPAFERVTGYSREEALGKNPRILKSGLHSRAFYEKMWESLRTQGYWRGEITNRRKNGSLYIEAAAISRIEGPDGEPAGYVAVKRDITQRKRAEFELRRRADELERARDQLAAQARELTVARDRALEAAKARSEFLARISHELRTPLNGIIGMLDVMMLTGLPPEQQECAAAALDSARKLLAILTDIIEFSRLESETLELREEETAVRELLEEAWDECREEAASKGIRITVAVEEGVPAMVTLDREKVLQAMGQLCRNAVKFTMEGEASIRVSLTDGNQGPALRFEVSDTGIGIPADEMGSLFDPFHQPGEFSTRRFRGTGLGLAIVRRLVELWGGEKGVESEPGRGSRFHFTVPLKQAERRAA